MKRITTIMFVMVVFNLPIPSYSQTLKILFDRANAKPYTFVEKDQLVGGIIKDIGDVLANELSIKVEYIKVPRKRYDQFLILGLVHTILIANPSWFPSSEQHDWTTPLFMEADVLMLSSRKKFTINSFDDLKGKTVGCIRGFHYPAELQNKFDSQEVIRHDVDTLEQNLVKLELGRIDCLINSNILVEYYLKEHNGHDQFVIATKIVSKWNIQALVSKKSPVTFNRINKAIEKMKKSGMLTKIIDKYK